MENAPLNQELFDEPYRFDFFQAVRLIERIFPDKQSVGGHALPDQESVRFRTKLSLDFPASQINSITQTVDDRTGQEKNEMLINFMGMLGTGGVLPMHYTELAIDRIRYRDTAMWAFLDIFTHRSVSLFFRAWMKYRFPVGYERGNDDFTSYLFDFAGLGTPGLHGRMSLDDESILPYTGLISQKPHSKNAVENIISDYFSIPATIIQFFGQWLDLSKGDQTFLGKANNALGRRSIAGTKVWDQQSKFRVKLGPMSLQHFTAFLPTGSAYKPLRALIRFITGQEFDFDLQLELKKEQVPATILTTRAVRRPMLGWTSFLKTKSVHRDDIQLVLDPVS
jgi:type VI secretion system protein ImpH